MSVHRGRVYMTPLDSGVPGLSTSHGLRYYLYVRPLVWTFSSGQVKSAFPRPCICGNRLNLQFIQPLSIFPVSRYDVFNRLLLVKPSIGITSSTRLAFSVKLVPHSKYTCTQHNAFISEVCKDLQRRTVCPVKIFSINFMSCRKKPGLVRVFFFYY